MSDTNVTAAMNTGAATINQEETKPQQVDSATSQRMHQMLKEKQQGKAPKEMSEQELRNALDQNRSALGKQQTKISDLKSQLQDPGAPMPIKMDLQKQLKDAERHELALAMQGTELQHHLDVKTGATSPTPMPSQETAQLHRIERQLDQVSHTVQGLQKQIDGLTAQRSDPNTSENMRPALDQAIQKSSDDMRMLLQKQSELQAERATAVSAGGTPLPEPSNMTREEIEREISQISGGLRKNGDELLSVMDKLAASNTPEAEKPGLQNAMSGLVFDRASLFHRGRELQAAYVPQQGGSGQAEATIQPVTPGPMPTTQPVAPGPMPTTQSETPGAMPSVQPVTPAPGSNNPAPADMTFGQVAQALADTNNQIRTKQNEVTALQQRLDDPSTSEIDAQSVKRQMLDAQQEITELSMYSSQLEAELNNKGTRVEHTLPNRPNASQMSQADLATELQQNDARREQIKTRVAELQAMDPVNGNMTPAEINQELMNLQREDSALSRRNAELNQNVKTPPPDPKNMTDQQILAELQSNNSQQMDCMFRIMMGSMMGGMMGGGMMGGMGGMGGMMGGMGGGMMMPDMSAMNQMMDLKKRGGDLLNALNSRAGSPSTGSSS